MVKFLSILQLQGSFGLGRRTAPRNSGGQFAVPFGLVIMQPWGNTVRNVLLLILLFPLCAVAQGGGGIVKKPSRFSVETTLDRLESAVKQKGFTVFARIDHAAGAAKIGKTLRPTQLLIFGNPKVGTALMSSRQSVGLDLPIRVVAWEDSTGQVWLAYNAPSYLEERYRIADRQAVIGKMTGALKNLTDGAVSAGD